MGMFVSAGKLSRRNEQGEVIWIVDMEAPDWHHLVFELEQKYSDAEVIRRSNMRAIVKEIQVHGGNVHKSLLKACKEFAVNEWSELPQKICFAIELPNGQVRQITIREEDREKDSVVVAYGDFEGLPSFLDYAREFHKK